MSVSVLETITIELLRRLNLLADSWTTYNTRVVEVIRPTRLGVWTPKDLQIVLTQGIDKILDDLSHPGNPPAIAHMQTFNIRCHIMTDEGDTRAIETVINTFAADVIKCVSSETEWYNFSGSAINSTWEPLEYIQADGGVDGVNVPLSVIYRVSETDPYAVRS